MVLPISGNLDALRYWTQSNMPAVYDDSLSYFELLSKVIAQLNTNTDFTNNVKNTLNDLINLVNSDKWMTENRIGDKQVSRRNLQDKSVGSGQLDTSTLLKWVLENMLGDQQVSTRSLKNGAVTFDKIDPVILNQPTTNIGQQAKFQQIDVLLSDIAYNVRSYGAKDDGTDTTAAIQSAIDDATAKGKSVFILGNTFNVGTLNVTCNLISDGKTLIKADRLNIKADNITLDNLNLYSKTAVIIAADGTTGSHFKNLTVKKCSVDYDPAVTTDWLSVRGQYVDNLIVQDCKFNIGGIQIVGCDNFTIKNNYIDGKDKCTNEPIHASVFSRGIIDGNTILNVANPSIDAMDLFSSGDRCIITNNRCIGLSTRGIELKISLTDPGDPNGSSDVLGYVESTVLSNNVFKNFRPTVVDERCQGISVSYVDARANKAFEVAKTQKGLIISHNIIEDFNVDNTKISRAYFVGIDINCSNAVIIGNVIRNIYTHAMNIWDSCGIKLGNNAGTFISKAIGCVVSDNMISGSEGSGINVVSAEKCIIKGNVIRKDETTGLTPKYGIRVYNGNLKTTQISNNVIECTITNGSGIHSESSGSPNTIDSLTITDNTLIDCGINIPAPQNCVIANNIIRNAMNSTGIAVGISSVLSLGNQIVNNNIEVSDDYAISIVNLQGFLIEGNYVKDAGQSAVLVSEPCSNGVIKNNISYSQASATYGVVRYLNITPTEQTTIKDSDNISF
jgi:parallel beta-helix repeat protein